MFCSFSRGTVEWAGIRQFFHMRSEFGPRRPVRPQGLHRSPFRFDRSGRFRPNRRGSAASWVAAPPPAGTVQPPMPRGRLTGRARRRQESARRSRSCVAATRWPAPARIHPADLRAGRDGAVPFRASHRAGRRRRAASHPCGIAWRAGGPPHEFALPRRAHRRRLVANGPATLNKGPAKRKLTKCQTAEPIC